MTEKEKTVDAEATKTESVNSESVNPAFIERDLRGYLGISLRGAVMGGADVIPGVSGGTIALITGIYGELIASIRSFDLKALKLLFSFQLKALSKHINLPFLIALFIGIGGAIVSLARVLPKLLKTYPAPVQGLFFGLILASIYLVWRQVEEKNATTYLCLVIGAISAYFLVGLIPVETPEHLWFIFLAGTIAIMAMILPGISGSFLLLVMGKYAFILQSLHNVIHREQLATSLPVVLVFILGCAVGILSFSRVLNWFLENYNAFMMSALAGLMIGSLRRIWPFQSYTTKMIRGKEKIISYANQVPDTSEQLHLLAIGMIVVGIILVVILDKVANRNNNKNPDAA